MRLTAFAAVAALSGLACHQAIGETRVPPENPLAFVDGGGLSVLDVAAGTAVRLAGPTASPLGTAVFLSPSRQLVLQIVLPYDWEVRGLRGALVARPEAADHFAGWIDDDTLLVLDHQGHAWHADPLSGALLRPAPRPDEIATWPAGTGASLSPDRTRIAWTRLPDPKAPPTDALILIADARTGRVLDRITSPPSEEAGALTWTSSGELVVITRSGIGRAGSDPGRLHLLPFAPCAARPWSGGQIITRAVELRDSTSPALVECRTQWVVDLDDGAHVRHWAQGASVLSPDGHSVVFEQEGALWAAALDGSGARRLAILEGPLRAIDW